MKIQIHLVTEAESSNPTKIATLQRLPDQINY